ncbi:MAG: Yip1 family protein [bacterium]
MIKCSICQTENDLFAVTCKSCKAFLQNRVPNLNFFETVWKVIESPSTTFPIIVRSEQKNYSLFLFTMSGIALSFALFWFFRLGNRFTNLFELIPAATISGFGIGIVLGAVLVIPYHIAVRLFGGLAKIRSSFALLAYSLVPVVLSLIFILPIELLTFGMYFFTANPPPYTINPVLYTILMGIDGCVVVWSLILAVIATVKGHRISILRSIIAMSITLAALVATIWTIATKYGMI